MALSAKIYSKTGKGARALASKSRDLSADALRLLSFIDSKTETPAIFDHMDKLSEDQFQTLLSELERDGYIRLLTNRDWGLEDDFDYRTGMVVDELSVEDFIALNSSAEQKAPKPSSAQTADIPDTNARQQAGSAASAADEARERAELEARMEAERKAQEHAEQQAKAAQDAAERQAAERKVEEERKAEEDRKAAEQAERQAKEEEKRRQAEESARQEAERRARLEEEARLKAEQEAREKAERAAREKAEQEARAEAERIAREEEKRKAREEKAARRKAAAEARVREQAARLEAERLARETAEREARVAEEARLQAEAEARALAEEQARQAAEEQARLEAERREREEAARRAEEEEARRQAEAAARAQAEEAARLEAERQAQEEAERRARREQEAQLKAEAAARAKAEKEALREAQRQAKEEAKRQAEAEQAARRQAKAEAAARAREEARLAAEQKAIEKAQQEVERALTRGTSTRANWLRPLIKTGLLYLPVLLIVLVVLAHWVNLSPLAGPVERIAAATIGEPVKVGGLRVALLPTPHLVLTDVAIGSDGDLHVGSVQVVPEVSAWFGVEKSLKSVEITEMTVDAAGLGRQLQWLQVAAANPQLSIGELELSDFTLQIPGLAAISFDGTVERSAAGDFSRLMLSAVEQDLSLELLPQDGNCRVALQATNWKAPFAPELQFSRFDAEAVADGKQLRFSRVEGELYGGSLRAEAVLAWTGQPIASGNFELQQVRLPQVLNAMLSSASIEGELDASATFSSRADAAQNLAQAVEVDASFQLRDGRINGVDLAEHLVSGSAGSAGSDATRFDRLAGKLQFRRGVYQFSQLELAAPQLKARGNLAVQPDQVVAGNVSAELAIPTRRIRANLAVEGKVGSVRLN